MDGGKKIRVLMQPSPLDVQKSVGGIQTILEAYAKVLPQHGIQFVRQGEEYDIAASHAGIGSVRPDVAILHGIYFTGDYAASKGEWHANARVAATIRHSLIVTSPSEWVAETIRREFRREPIIVPHGIFPEEWENDEGVIPKTVLWAKNRYHDVCDPTPVNLIAVRMPDYRFLVTVAAKGAPKNVVEIGVQPRQNLKKFIAQSEMVLSTVKETWGILYAESLASGTPVIAANYGHVPRMVKHGLTGYVYKNGDTEDLERGIRWISEYHDILSGNAKIAGRMLSWHNGPAARMASVLRLASRLREEEKSYSVETRSQRP